MSTENKNLMKRQAPATSSTCSRAMKGKQVTFVGAYVCCVRVSYAYYTMAIRVVHYTKKDMALSIYLRDLEHAKVSGSGHGYNFGGCCPKKRLNAHLTTCSMD